MYIDKNKLRYTIAAFLLSLLILMGGQLLFSKFVAYRPLLKTFSQKEYVDQVNIKKETGRVIIEIYLKDVDNLQETYGDIYNTAFGLLKGRPFAIKILNKPDEYLENIYNQEVQFIVYEGIKTGEFFQMRSHLDQLEAKYKIDIAVFLDDENLYLKIKNDRSVFYKIIKRS
ncbi:hypothetical protein [Thermosediminibacter litoriperuensis]|uniref:Uncharacterized protein n=1 Tax=Thermosediminibacter litoriperuensis TaxID=291989 RepID=A0A5S5AQJ7_9FIRM|nr:hypothetical protein [Thermosediminibacter litoriperuensis]TYP54310.1 hypothetical protein LZ11_01377 [Thermosediminibacter litoriperuensis]